MLQLERGHPGIQSQLPYEELEEISVVTKEGKTIILLKDGRFVLEGTEALNEPFDRTNL